MIRFIGFVAFVISAYAFLQDKSGWLPWLVTSVVLVTLSVPNLKKVKFLGAILEWEPVKAISHSLDGFWNKIQQKNDKEREELELIVPINTKKSVSELDIELNQTLEYLDWCVAQLEGESLCAECEHKNFEVIRLGFPNHALMVNLLTTQILLKYYESLGEKVSDNESKRISELKFKLEKLVDAGLID